MTTLIFFIMCRLLSVEWDVLKNKILMFRETFPLELFEQTTKLLRINKQPVSLMLFLWITKCVRKAKYYPIISEFNDIFFKCQVLQPLANAWVPSIEYLAAVVLLMLNMYSDCECTTPGGNFLRVKKSLILEQSPKAISLYGLLTLFFVVISLKDLPNHCL